MNGKNALVVVFALFAAGFVYAGGKSEEAAAPGQAPKEAVVNLYSARHYESDNALYAEFQKASGIKVNVVSAGAPELIERIKREAEATEADVFITVDGGVLFT
ncbi:MAG: hypothetical protein LBC67_07455, partial [Spirochaetales bacterium]|nr:hypothetical protein [Spirochaetales bacterium]